jgi:FtsZ-binding cell division protein ZapB
MSEKPEVLRLADDLTTKADAMKSLMEAAQILRIQHARNMDLLDDNERLTAENERLRKEVQKWQKSFGGHLYIKTEDYAELIGKRDALKTEVERLREEVRVLRLCGNKDCTAMADEAMKKAALRREEKK